MSDSLLPFEGGIKEQFPGNISSVYSGDYSDDGSITYRFNSLGYRGEEYDPELESIVVVGSSNAFGVGVNYEESWPIKFKELYEQKHNCKVNLLNFSSGNASNETIARRVVSQLSTNRPVLLLVDYTLISLKELADDEGNPIYLGPWDETEESELYYYFYNEANGACETVSSMILVQNFCKANEIPLVCGWLEIDDSEDVTESVNPVVRTLAELVDWSTFYEYSCYDKPVIRDHSRDGYHIGGETAAIYAQKLYETYIKRYPIEEQCHV